VEMDTVHCATCIGGVAGIDPYVLIDHAIRFRP